MSRTWMICVWAATLTLSCGGKEDSGGSDSNSTGGTTIGGTTGYGGSGYGGNTSTTSGGWTSTSGGSTSSSGGSTNGTPGGSCPPSNPDNDECGAADVGLVCSYDDEQCQCEFGSWQCRQPDPDCAPTAPADNSECTDPGLSCTYTDQECVCRGGEWECNPLATCPATPPESGVECDAQIVCNYDSTTCTCPMLGGGGPGGWQQGQWLCTGDPITPGGDCPPTEPSGRCNQPGQLCQYDEQACFCTNQNQWTCP